MSMRIPPALVALAITAAISMGSGAALAADYTINVWADGSGPNDMDRIGAIKIAAGLLEAEAAVRGE